MHINKKVLREYLKVNHMYWKKADGNKKTENMGNGYIYMLVATWMEMGQYIITGDFLAKSLEKTYHLPVLAVSKGGDDAVEEINDSFGIQSKNIDRIHIPILKRYFLKAKAYYYAIFKKGEALLKVKYHGVPVGDLMHDSLAASRAGSQQVFDMNKSLVLFDSKQFYKYFMILERSYILMKDYRPKYIISRGVQRESGFMSLMAIHFGAAMITNFFYFGENLPVVNPKDDINESYKLFNMQYKLLRKEITKGGLDDIDFGTGFVISGGDKNNQLERDEILERLHINNGKKNILILPHCLIDSARVVSQERVFLDYNEWLVDTLETISNITNVNWILKDHPRSVAYKQVDYIRSLYDKYSAKNPGIYWLDKEITGENVKKIADVVLTDSGDAGCEYVAFGIPTVSASNTYYTRFGVGYRAKSKKSYHYLLKNMHRIPRPSQESMDLARKLIYLRKNKYGSKEVDDFIMLCTKYERAMLDNLANGGSWTIDNTGFISELIELYKENKIEDSFYANYTLNKFYEQEMSNSGE